MIKWLVGLGLLLGIFGCRSCTIDGETEEKCQCLCSRYLVHPVEPGSLCPKCGHPVVIGSGLEEEQIPTAE